MTLVSVQAIIITPRPETIGELCPVTTDHQPQHCSDWSLIMMILSDDVNTLTHPVLWSWSDL